MVKLQRLFQIFALAGSCLAASLTIALPVYPDTIRTPIDSTISFQGTTGGQQSSQCGYIAGTPNHNLVITEPLVSLRFVLESQGEPTLLIRNEQGRSECVMSDQFSEGMIDLPGAWEQGSYSIFIGDRTGGSHAYSLSISQER